MASAETTAPLQDRIEESAAWLRREIGTLPTLLIVAGSGLSGYAKSLTESRAIPYGQIPNFPASTVVGHAGELVIGKAGGVRVLVMAGRKHIYEGVDAAVATLPVRAIVHAGIRTILLSNAAGSLNRNLVPGDIMLISDHINLQWRNPLIGPNLDKLGPRFPDMSNCWDRDLRALMRDVAVRQQVPLREGVYLGLTGPTYETKAEINVFRTYTDAVGMSTVLEDLVAVHAGARCIGLSVITNSAVAPVHATTTHDEVIETGRAVAASFERLVTAFAVALESHPAAGAART